MKTKRPDTRKRSINTVDYLRGAMQPLLVVVAIALFIDMALLVWHLTDHAQPVKQVTIYAQPEPGIPPEVYAPAPEAPTPPAANKRPGRAIVNGKRIW